MANGKNKDNKKSNFKKNDTSSQYFSRRPDTTPGKKTAKTPKGTTALKKKTDISKASHKAPKNYKKRKNSDTIKLGVYFKKNNMKIIFGVIGIVAILFILFIFTHKNAYAVYLSGETGKELVGIIDKDNTTTEESFYDTAITGLSESIGGAKVEVTQKIEFEEVHARRDEIVTQDFVLSELYKKWDYKIEATEITVDAVPVGALQSPEEAQNVLDNVGKQYIGEGATYVSTSFEEEVKVAPKFIDPENLGTVDSVTSAMNQVKDTSSTYLIQSGDNISSIASANNVTDEEIMALNPTIDPYNLKVGEEITLVTKAPIVTVITKENIITEEVVPMPVEEKENPDKYKTYTKVLSQGKDGKAEITTQITRKNGVEQSSEIVNTKEIEKAVPEVLEVGTGEQPKNVS